MIAAIIAVLTALEGYAVWRWCARQSLPYVKQPVPYPTVVPGILATTNSDVRGLT